MSQYHIYQTDSDYAFMGWDLTKEKFNMEDYRLVYSGELIDRIKYGNKVTECNQDDYKVLEELFEMFILNHPNDYKARSMSVSDVVEIVRKGKVKRYYCDSIGFVEIK